MRVTRRVAEVWEVLSQPPNDAFAVLPLLIHVHSRATSPWTPAGLSAGSQLSDQHTRSDVTATLFSVVPPHGPDDRVRPEMSELVSIDDPSLPQLVHCSSKHVYSRRCMLLRAVVVKGRGRAARLRAHAGGLDSSRIPFAYGHDSPPLPRPFRPESERRRMSTLARESLKSR